MLTNEQLQNLSILADQRDDDHVFALCAQAWNGDRAARRVLTDAVNRARASRRVS